MNILAIESSCDDTAAAVVRDGRTVLSSCVSSQIEMHTVYGGVVPEIASRKHVEAISRLADQIYREPFSFIFTTQEVVEGVPVSLLKQAMLRECLRVESWKQAFQHFQILRRMQRIEIEHHRLLLLAINLSFVWWVLQILLQVPTQH